MSVDLLARDHPASFSSAMLRRIHWSGGLAAGTVYVYLATLALPLRPDIGSAVLGGGALLAALSASERRFGPARARGLDRALLAFLGASGIALVGSIDPARSLRLSAAFLPALLLFVLLARHLPHAEGARVVSRMLAVVTVIVGAMLAQAAWTGMGDHTPSTLVRAAGSPLLLVPNDAVLLALIAPLALGLVLTRAGGVERVLGLLALGATALVLVVLQSRLGMLTMLGGLSLVVWLVGSRRGLAVLAGLAAMALIVDAAQGFGLLAKFGCVRDPRVALWITGLAMWVDAPLLGHGPRTFGLLYAQYRDTLSLPAWLPVDDRFVPWAHSLWVETLAEQGVLGLVALVVLLASALYVAWRQFHGSTGDTRVTAAAVFAALVGFCAAATVELTFVRQWVVVLLCALLGVSAARKE